MSKKIQPKRVLLIDVIHKILQEKLNNAGITVDYHPEYTYQDVKQVIHLYDAIVVRSKIIIDKDIIDNAKNLTCIARSGAGMDAIDVEYAEKKGILCLNSPEGNRDAVGEHTLGLLLCLFNKIAYADKQVRERIWHREENRGLEIKGKTVGIIGYGNMGQAFAKRLQGFDCKVLAYDKYNPKQDSFALNSSLEELFEKTDVLSLHVPLTEETKYMVDKSFIDNFQKPFYLINTSRGKVISLADLLFAMQEGKILGCGLDVLEYENFANEIQDGEAIKVLQSLFARNDTVFTPHVAGWSRESYFKLADVLADKIIVALNS